MFDGDGRGEAGDEIEVRLFQLAGELSRVRRHRVQKAALAFSKNDVEGESGFSRAAQPGDDDELVVRNGGVNVLEIVVTEAVDGNFVFGGRLCFGSPLCSRFGCG